MNAGDGGTTEGRTGGEPAEAHGPAVDAPECFTRANEIGLGGTLGVKPGATPCDDGAIIAGSAATSAGRRWMPRSRWMRSG